MLASSPSLVYPPAGTRPTRSRGSGAPFPERSSTYFSVIGISVTSTLEAARALAARAPNLGRFIAVLELAEDGPVRFAQTGRAPEHYDLWGEPRDVLAAVVRVVSAE
jgi:hypothetical protein